MRVGQSVAVVTGASSGIGRATAALLADRGARVWAVARSEDELERLARAHPGITPFRADITLALERDALAAAVGPVDILVNNAGIGWTGMFEDMSPDDWLGVFDVNVLGLVDLTSRVLPGMLERRHGHICNVASVASWVAVPPITVYCATKFAVQGFSEGLRRELRGRGVTVATVNPGPVSTRFSTRAQVGNRPTADLPARRMPGVPASWVARAVARTVEMNGVPGWSTVTVPRLLGLSRLGAVPGLQLVVDVAAMVARRPLATRLDTP